MHYKPFTIFHCQDSTSVIEQDLTVGFIHKKKDSN